MESTSAEARRREATRAFIRYFVLGFIVVVVLSGMAVYAVADARHQTAQARSLRVEYCRELEKLKTQNREDVAEERRNFKRNIRLFHLEDTPELRKIAEKRWDKVMARNAPKPCPYTGHDEPAAAGHSE